MWFQKRRRTLLFLVLCVVPILYALISYSSDSIQSASVVDFAESEAKKRFGSRSKAHLFETFYDRLGTPAVELYLVTKDQEAIPEDLEELMDQGREFLETGEALVESGYPEEGEELIDTGRALLFQENRFGTLLVATRQGPPFLLAFHHGLPTHLVARAEATQKAQAFAGGDPVELLGILYVSPLQYYFEFDHEGQRLLISPFDPRTVRRPDFEADSSTGIPTVYQAPGEGTGDQGEKDAGGAEEEGAVEIGVSAQFPESQLIPDVPDYNQPQSLTNSCGPVAAACLLGYWDAKGYEDFLGGAGTNEDVKLLIEELSDLMGWNPSVGVYYSQIPLGLRRIIDLRGYVFGIQSLISIGSLDTVKQKIMEGRPFIYGSQENPWNTPHYVVVVGYEGNFMIVHDNWSSTPVDYYVNWNALGHSDDMITTLTPQGAASPASDSFSSGAQGGGDGCFLSSFSR
jgi:hypothetical protein